jgi:hypothetical protein
MTSTLKFPTQHFFSENEFTNFQNKNTFFITIDGSHLPINISINPLKNNIIKQWIVNSTMLKFRYKNKKKIDIKKNNGIFTLGSPRKPSHHSNNVKIIIRTVRFNNNYIKFNIKNKTHILVLEYIIKNKLIKSITMTTIPQ